MIAIEYILTPLSEILVPKPVKAEIMLPAEREQEKPDFPLNPMFNPNIPAETGSILNSCF